MSPGRAPPSGASGGGASLFFHGLGMALMSRHHIDFVALDLPLQDDRRTTLDDPLAKSPDHRPGVVLVDVELLGDLQTRFLSKSFLHIKIFNHSSGCNNG